MAKKILKTRTQITTTLDNEILWHLQRMSKETRIPLSKLYDEAVLQMVMGHNVRYGKERTRLEESP